MEETEGDAMAEGDCAADRRSTSRTRPAAEPGAGAETSPIHLPHAAAECPKCFSELQRDRDWWPGASERIDELVGLVVSRDDMPLDRGAARRARPRFGAPSRASVIPPPSRLESREERLVRLLRHAPSR